MGASRMVFDAGPQVIGRMSMCSFCAMAKMDLTCGFSSALRIDEAPSGGGMDPDVVSVPGCVSSLIPGLEGRIW